MDADNGEENRRRKRKREGGLSLLDLPEDSINLVEGPDGHLHQVPLTQAEAGADGGGDSHPPPAVDAEGEEDVLLTHHPPP